jgi:hypothetical protein
VLVASRLEPVVLVSLHQLVKDEPEDPQVMIVRKMFIPDR